MDNDHEDPTHPILSCDAEERRVIAARALDRLTNENWSLAYTLVNALVFDRTRTAIAIDLEKDDTSAGRYLKKAKLRFSAILEEEVLRWKHQHE